MHWEKQSSENLFGFESSQPIQKGCDEDGLHKVDFKRADGWCESAIPEQ